MTPTTLSRYRILRKLGEGGMGEVYLAEDVQLGRQVAIKFLAQRLMSEDRARKRFLREAHIVAGLDHPNICAIYEIGEEDGRRFAVMQYVEGETLDALLRRGSSSLTEVLQIAIQIASALREAHEHGVIHRDIKPQNIIVNARGHVRVLDFGLSKLIQADTAPDAKTLSMVSETGTVIGTIPYMSPEQVSGEEIDVRSDLFSFGTVLYELATGTQPFLRRSAPSMIAAVVGHDPPALSFHRPGTPAALEEIVRKCLKKKKEDRYQTADQLLEDLRSVSHAETQPDTSHIPWFSRDLSGSVRPAGLRKFGLIGLAIILIAAVGYGFYYLWHRSSPANVTNSPASGSAINSIAVLPFVNETANPDSEYLSDGLTESLMGDLSLMPNMRVIARSSVFRYKNRVVDAQTVGRELNVQAVLMGHIRTQGDENLVTAELINTLDNSLIWTSQYAQKSQKFIDIEQRISRAIGEKLQSRSGVKTTASPRRNTTDDEAYHLYLKGRYSLSKRTNPKQAADFFQQAIERDPAYAQAFAGLADAYGAIGLGLYEGPPPLEIMPKAKAAALKAIEIDETLPEAHLSLALVKMQFDFDWTGAESELKRAIALNSNYAPAYQWFVLYHLIMNRFDDALADARKAQELDPLSLIIYTNIARTLYYSRKFDLAIEQLKSALELDKNLLSAHILLGLCYENKKMYKEAIAEFNSTVPLTNNAPWSIAALGHAYAVSGRRNEALKIIEQLKTKSAKTYISPFHVGAIYNGLGEKDQAFAWFNKALADRSGLLVYIKIEPEFDNLRNDPAYLDLMRRIGLEQ